MRNAVMVLFNRSFQSVPRAAVPKAAKPAARPGSIADEAALVAALAAGRDDERRPYEPSVGSLDHYLDVRLPAASLAGRRFHIE
jgi:hypothetical protein